MKKSLFNHDTFDEKFFCVAECKYIFSNYGRASHRKQNLDSVNYEMKCFVTIFVQNDTKSCFLHDGNGHI